MALDSNIRSSSYNRLAADLSRGILSTDQLRAYYVKARKLASDRLRRIARSDIAYQDAAPVFRKVKNLITDRDLLSEIADINRFLNSKYSTVTGRRAARKQSLATLRSRGMDFIDESNYNNWIRFMQYFKASGVNLYLDSESQEVEELFNEVENFTASEMEQAFLLFTSGLA